MYVDKLRRNYQSEIDVTCCIAAGDSVSITFDFGNCFVFVLDKKSAGNLKSSGEILMQFDMFLNIFC